MFENPILLEMLGKQRQAELLMQNQKTSRLQEIMRVCPSMSTLMNDSILLLAELLIMAGMNLKKHWAIDGNESMDRFASSLNSK